MHNTRALLFACILTAAWAGLAPSPGLAQEGGGEKRPLSFTVVAGRPLPAPIQWAFDLRWWTDDSVVVAAGRDGVFEVAATSASAPPRLVAGSDRLEYAAHLAVSQTQVAAAAPFGWVARRARSAAGGWREDVPMGAILDLDVSADQILLLGGRRVEVPGEAEPQWAPHGGILFSGRSTGDLSDLRLRMTARSGADGKAREMARCYVLEPGAVRFLSDGRYVVAPGVQPGISLYSAAGRLLRAWDSTSLGFYDSCDLDDGASARLAADPVERVTWWQRHVLLDEIVPWGDGFALLIRSPTKSGARWTFVPFDDEGPGTAVELPVAAESPGLRLRADSRGNRLALLVVDYELRDPDDRRSGGSPRHPPRLVLLEKAGE